MTNETKTQSLVTLPKKVAEAIAELRKDGFTNRNIIVDLMNAGPFEHKDLEVARNYFFAESDVFLSALVNGYQVEKTPEEKVLKYYKEIHSKWAEVNTGWPNGYYEGSHDGLLTTLNLLGITIPGVNAPAKEDE